MGIGSTVRYVAPALLLLVACFCSSGCTAGRAAAGLRIADNLAHITKVADRFAAADDEIGQQIAALEARDPGEPIGASDWAAIIGSILGSVLLGGAGLHRYRNGTRAKQLAQIETGSNAPGRG